MNGADGKPFKTRSGGVMRLENLIADINSAVLDKMNDNSEKKGQTDIDRDEAEATAKIVGLAALKYGDLSNQASKDYVFDVDRFSSFEGNTGPYILYTIVRIKSIIAKYKAASGDLSDLKINLTDTESEKNLSLALVKFSEVVNSAYSENAPHKICQFIYDVSNAFNGFYHDTKILSEPDEDRKKSYISLISLTRDILLTCIDLLGIQCPERM
jgi:arginyl-tRNA synthetase